MWYEANAVTDVGLNRQENQDSRLVQEFRDLRGGPTLCVAVADGMGGMANGCLAAESAIEAVEHGLSTFSAQKRIAPSESLCRALVDIAHQSVKNALSDGDDGGTTLTVGLLQRSRAYLGHVGDSRAYLWRRGALIQLTVDDRLEGAPSNVVSQALGYSSSLSVATRTIRLKADDALLLCSDGLYKEVDETTIAGYLGNGHAPEEIAQLLIERALESGGRDNITAAVVRVHGRSKPRWLPVPNRRIALLSASLLLVLGLMSWIGISLTQKPESRTAGKSGRDPSASEASNPIPNRVNDSKQGKQGARKIVAPQITLAPNSTLRVWTVDAGADRPETFSTSPIQIQLVGTGSNEPLQAEAVVRPPSEDPPKGSRLITIERKGDKVFLSPAPQSLQVFVVGAPYVKGNPIVCHDITRPWRVSWHWDDKHKKPVRLYFAPLQGGGLRQ